MTSLATAGVGKIHAKLAAILAEFPCVTKGRNAPQQAGGYAYRGIDDSLSALHPLLAKHGVYIQLVSLQPQFSEGPTTKSGAKNVRCVLFGQVRFVCGEDGSFVECALVGEGIDTADKSLMKAQANGLKYVIWYTFAVATEETRDSEAFDDDDEPRPQPRHGVIVPIRGKGAAEPVDLETALRSCPNVSELGKLLPGLTGLEEGEYKRKMRQLYSEVRATLLKRPEVVG